MRVLGIETSCDETAVAVVEDGKRLLSNVVATSIDLHVMYGGVVPEIAARSHIESMLPVVEEALTQAFGGGDHWDEIDAIAVTYGAGLGGSLLVGVLTARTLAIMKNKPLYGINHVEAHVYANFLTEGPSGKKTEVQLGGKVYNFRSEQPEFPMLALIVSGGHSQLVLFEDHFSYTLLGQKRDDAIGEAFDKVAKILGLPYPGGPSIAQAAQHGDRHRYKLPKAQLEGESDALRALRESRGIDRTQRLSNYDFSFSGLKTAVLRLAQSEIGEDFTFPSFELAGRLSEAQKNDIAASFDYLATETLVDKAVAAYEEFQPKSVVIAGGVAASKELRKQLAERLPIAIEYPDFKLCTDNGAMIATLGCYHAMRGQPTVDPYSLAIAPNLSM